MPPPDEAFETAYVDQVIGPDEIDLVTLDRPWTAIDVYVDARGDAAATGLLVSVYGLVDGVPGLLFSGAIAALRGDRPVHGVGGKAAQRYRVRASAPGGPTSSPVRVAAIGYGRQPS